MNSWFECKVAYDSTYAAEGEDPKNSKRKETYLVDALSFTEAEARIIKEITPFATGELDVEAVKKSRIHEMVFNDDPEADKWYRSKVMVITLVDDEEKHTAITYMVKAKDFENALRRLVDVGMAGFLDPYEIASLTETQIMDVFPYEAPAEEKK